MRHHKQPACKYFGGKQMLLVADNVVNNYSNLLTTTGMSGSSLEGKAFLRSHKILNSKAFYFK